MNTSTADLRGKRVLIIGGETAAGRSLAVALGEAGADLAVATLAPGSDAEFAVNSVLNELWAMGRQGVALVIDAREEIQLREAVRHAERELGGLDLAAAISPEKGAGLALNALPSALGDRPVVTFSEDAPVDEALRSVIKRL